MPPNKTKPPNIDLSDNDFTCILAAAIRYTLGRESYMPSLVIGYITPLLPALSDRALSVMNEDMKRNDDMDKRMDGFEAVKGYRHGAFGSDVIDKPGWMKFWAAIRAEMNRREETSENRTD